MKGRMTIRETTKAGAKVTHAGEPVYTWVIDVNDEDRTRVFGQRRCRTMAIADRAARRMAAKLGIELEDE